MAAGRQKNAKAYGLSLYDVKTDSYNIIINAADSLSPGRVLWTKMHEIGHIYLGHLKDNRLTEINKEELPHDVYAQMEAEADMFAGEVLASKWLMRNLGIHDEKDITYICGISDEAARNRYAMAMMDYSFTPLNVTYTLSRFSAYMKEVTVCCEKSRLEMPRFATSNQPRKKYAKAKAPFLRVQGECPYCGGA